MSTSAALVSRRVSALLALLIMVLCLSAVPAMATEAGGAAVPSEDTHAPTIDEVGTNNEVSNQFKPEPAEAPPFMRWLNWPLAIVGFAVAMGLLFAYLTWQPRFAEERRSKRRR